MGKEVWRNIIIEHKNEWGKSYGLHEGYFNLGNLEKINSWTEESMIGEFDSKEELVEALEAMLKDAKKSKIFTWEDLHNDSTEETT